ncbi:rho-GTPase-activating protein [Histoplasma capsulatum]|uniref:Rho-GTPase-activating protein n=1 Tax=Ajellomyces capsulatus TaxID=5037 RepID=A0A8A1MJW3_AJECA|nr:rho-GTPase-activating protein [Histoplasma capsulatum]
MPPPGGRAFPPDLVPGKGPRNNGAQPPANLGDPGMYGESYQTQPPTGNMSSSTGSAGAGVPWDNNNSPPMGGGAFDTDTYHAPDIRTGRGPHPSNTQQGGAGSGSGPRDRPRLNGGSGSKSPGGRTLQCMLLTVAMLSHRNSSRWTLRMALANTLFVRRITFDV